MFTQTELALMDYFNKGAVLAENLQRCLKKDSTMDDKAIFALNEFIIAAHKIVDLQLALEARNMKLN